MGYLNDYLKEKLIEIELLKSSISPEEYIKELKILRLEVISELSDECVNETDLSQLELLHELIEDYYGNLLDLDAPPTRPVRQMELIKIEYTYSLN